MGDVTRVARIEMPDGTPVWARISGAEELAVPSGELSYTDTGFADRVEAQVESLQSVVTSVARSLAAPLRTVRPDEVSVEFGIELTAKAGKVVGLLADGEAKAGIKVTLTWNGGPPDPDSPAVDSSGLDSSGLDSSASDSSGLARSASGSSDHDPSIRGSSVQGSSVHGLSPHEPAVPRSGQGVRPGDACAGASPGASVHGGAGDPVTGSGA
ncbi:CU044_2847 family protein [Streptomyces acidicola]|uniref:CU044_2847 family protein n=1 Tax=Streptomyces acidicola TaxID=2596892 RepID=UPI00380DF702